MAYSYLWIGHCVKGADRQRILVHEEKVGAVLFLDNISELLLVLGAQIVVIVLVAAKKLV